MKSKKYEITIKSEQQDFNQVAINDVRDAVAYARNFYHEDIELYESFFIILLNRANKTIGYAKISQGGTCGTVVDGKIVCKYVIDSLASSVIMVHNHPSGSRIPSQEDLSGTTKIKQQLSLFDVSLLDHIILTKDSYFSFAEENYGD